MGAENAGFYLPVKTLLDLPGVWKGVWKGPLDEPRPADPAGRSVSGRW